MNNITNYKNESSIKIRKAKIEDLETIVKFNYNLAKETEDKELDLEILTKGVRAILNDSTFRGTLYNFIILITSNSFKYFLFNLSVLFLFKVCYKTIIKSLFYFTNAYLRLLHYLNLLQ